MFGLEQNWFLWALVSMFFQGVHAFLFKKLVEDKGDIVMAGIAMPAIVMLLAAISLGTVSTGTIAGQLDTLLILAGVQGALFFLTTHMRMEALEVGAPAHVVFPIVKSSVILILVLAYFLFPMESDVFNITNDINSWKRPLGILLVIISTYLLMDWKISRSNGQTMKGISYALLAMVSSAGTALVAKYIFVIDVTIDIFAFILISNAANMIIAILWSRFSFRDVIAQSMNIGLRTGIVMGVLSFLGFAAFLQSVKYGDISVVASINAIAILVPVILSAKLYGEQLTVRKEVAVFVSIVAIILIS